MKKVTLFMLCLCYVFSAHTQSDCTEFSYSISYKEYRTLSDKIDISEIGDLNLYKFKIKKKKKHVRKFMNDNDDPVKVTAIIDHDNYYPRTVTLPLISVYGETNFTEALNSFGSQTGLDGGSYIGNTSNWMTIYQDLDKGMPNGFKVPTAGTYTDYGTVINNYDNYIFTQDEGEDLDFTENVTFYYPTPNDLVTLQDAGYTLTTANNVTTVAGDEIEVVYNLNDYSITYTYEDGSYEICSYTNMDNGQILLTHSVTVSYESLVNGICTEQVIIKEYQDYACSNSWVEPYESNEVTSSSINLYPNPSNDFIRVELPEEFQNQTVQLSIKDLSGRTIKSRNFNATDSFSLSLQNILNADGLYILTVSNSQEKLSQKFLFTKK